MNVGLLNGTVEVFVWEELLATTRETLKDAKPILVSGVVKDRGEEQVTISASEINEFILSDVSLNSLDKPVQNLESNLFSNDETEGDMIEVKNVENKKPTSISKNGSGVNMNQEIENSTEQDSNSVNKRLLITIIESKKVETDRVLLNNLIRKLLEHNGNDDVEMEVKTPTSVVKLAWPLIKVEATTELAEYVAEMLGDSGYVALVGH